jgi:chitinase
MSFLKLSSSALAILQAYGFEGLDLDYEYPDSGDKTNFATWVSELRAKLGSDYQLTSAVSAVESTIRAGLDVVSVSRDLERDSPKFKNYSLLRFLTRFLTG